MSIRRRVLSLAVPALLAACHGDTPAGPGGPGIASLVLRAAAPPSLSRFGLNPTVDRVKASLLKDFPNESVDTIATKTLSFGIDATSLNLSFSLVLNAAAETLRVELDYQTIAGRTLFTASHTVVAVAGVPTVPPAFVPVYQGPGQNITALTIAPRSTTVPTGGSLNFSAAAFDIQGAPIPEDSVYLSWGASSGHINALGTFTAPSTPGAVKITVATPSLLPGNADSVTVNVLAAGAGALTGQVIDGETGLRLAGVTLSVFNDQDSLITTVQTAADGRYTTPPLQPGTYRIVASLNGYLGTTLFDATFSGGTTSTVPTIPLVPSTTSLGDLSGVVKDATNNQPIVGAAVVLRDGVNATTSAPLDSTVTDTGGNYQFVRHPAGTFTVGATATGYTPGYRTSVIVGGGATTGADVVLSSVGSGVVRIVLQWGATPSDLDSHLTGPDTNGTRFHVYYGNTGSLTARPFANLDVDDTDQFGPETITLSQQFAGIYRYSVHDFTNGGDSTSQALAGSGAHVDLYIGGSLAQSFFVPNPAGTLWTVFELNGTTITPINTITSDQPGINLRADLRASGSGTPSDRRVIGQDLKRHPK